MTIFGSVAEMAFPELLTMLGNYCGKLEVWDLGPFPHLEFHLRHGVVCVFRVNRHSLTDPLQLNDYLLSMIDLKDGNFEFNKADPETIQDQIHLPIQRTLLNTVTYLDELNAYRTRFGDPKARFKTATFADANGMEDAIVLFWQRCRGLLDRGTDAEEIAQHLNLSLQITQLYLYKLRLQQKVVPAHAPVAPPPAGATQPNENFFAVN